MTPEQAAEIISLLVTILFGLKMLVIITFVAFIRSVFK